MSLAVQLGLLLALATAFASVVGFLYKQRGAVESPAVELRRPVSTSLALFRSRWYVLGRELEDIFPIGFLPPNQALFVAIMSYNGGVNFGLLADYDSMEDVEEFAAGLNRSLAELEEAASAVAPA